VPVQVFLGGSFLRHFLTTIDYPERVVRFGRYDDPSHIPADEFVGVGFTLRRDGDDWVVFEVYPDHDAYRDGVRGGDVVEEIDGMPLTGQPGQVVDAALRRFALGQEVPMSISRLGTARDVRILVEDLLPSLPPPT
jgi:C-terminal processing protease CtpA/Prc